MKVKKWAVWTIAAGLFCCVVLGVGVWQYYGASAVKRDAVVLIPTGSDFSRVMDSLRAGDLLRNETLFRTMARAKGLDRRVSPGRYELKQGMGYSEVINRIQSGLQSPVRITFHNIRTMDRLAAVLSRQIELDSMTLVEAFANDSIVVAYGYTPQTFMAMFIPNTYEVYWNCSVDDLLQRMKRESDRFWASRDAKLARCGLTRNEVITLASIVYEETKRQSEMPVVAGVYINRLRRGMPLQADPTVKFALGDFSLRRILHKHLEVDSPYNTYRVTGLPPGPICMPSIAAIDAVLNYQEHDYLYFCAKEDLSGAHNFARTLAEHNRNARAYAAALNRLKIR